MDNFANRMGTIERKASWEGHQNNPFRNPNFRKNQNPNVGRASPDQDIRPPFHENYVEASTSNEQIEDTHINLMGLKSEQQVFLTQEDQDDHDIKFQTKSGESFDFKQGYDLAVYEVHKQYKLRTRTIDVSDPIKPKDAKQRKKVKDKATIIEPANKTDPKLKEVTVEDVSDIQPSNNQPFVSFPSKDNVNSTP